MIAKEFVIPKWVKVEEGASDRYARFVIEPFERGYGTTIGNSLRRVLLASLAGSAVTAVRIEDIPHEFSAIPGVKEDLADVVLNFKKCQIRLNREESVIFSFKHKGQGVVTAGDVFAEKDIDVFNPEQVIFEATSKSASMEMEIKVARGRGYKTSEHFELEHAPLGTIYLDAGFSPVTKVNFLVEDARVGQRTDYDRLILDVWSNGSITPDKAVEEAARLLIEHLKIFVQQDVEEDREASPVSGEDPELMRLLARPVEELELSARAANCLKAENVRTIGELVVRSEQVMMKLHNFGKKSLDEVKSVLASQGLSLGMNVTLPKTDPSAQNEAGSSEDAEDDE
jgi:DNA-directed RNA polymerase subunit alpha